MVLYRTPVYINWMTLLYLVGNQLYTYCIYSYILELIFSVFSLPYPWGALITALT
ncbi:hypothetical protein VCRA2127O344_20249 [Vibrio crassostreae]|nr:hypothetical protein VCRA2127O344_20249 [Vibrio crassostreae]